MPLLAWMQFHVDVNEPHSVERGQAGEEGGVDPGQGYLNVRLLVTAALQSWASCMLAPEDSNGQDLSSWPSWDPLES